MVTKGAWVVYLRELAERLAREFPGDPDVELALAKIGNAEAYLRRGCLESPPTEQTEALAPAAPTAENGQDDGA